MQKFLKILTVSVALVLLTFGTAMADEPVFEPLSPRYLEWLEQHQNDSSSSRLMKSGTDQTESNGYIPFHIDLSHLAKNPPREILEPGLTKSNAIPTKYDLRDVNGKSYLTDVKSQSPYGTCWAHAAIGAIESNLLKQNLGTYDLSEMHLAWFAFKNSDKSKAFDNINSASLQTVLDRGGNAFYPTALFTRLAGPVNESVVPYPTQPSASTPESYAMAGIRLREVYYLADSRSDVNSSSTQRDIIKQRIMDNGSVVASYWAINSLSNPNYNKSANGMAYYYNNSTSTNHAVQIVGWDDNFSRNNFYTKPNVDGAWLIKNSWGTSFGDSGYFWMSYAQYLTDGTAFIAEKLDSSMKVYDYAPLGWCGTWGWNVGKMNAANVFKSERTNEKLTEVGFYTPDNNIGYQISVYTGMTSMPSSSPINGNPVATASGTIPYAGWHTITLNSPVSLTNGQYFSVVVTYTNYTKAPVERNGGMATNAVIEDGSFFSSDGRTWTTGKNASSNATVKAYTTTSSSTPVTGTAPKITTSSLLEGKVGTAYTSGLSASGSTPITWSVSSGSLPDGITLDASKGEFSGIPTKAGSFTFTVTATNAIGTDSKSYTITVAAAGVQPEITTISLPTWQVGRNSSYTMTASGTTPITWTKSGNLPTGMTFSSAGVLSGTPTTAGQTRFSVTATNNYGSDTRSIILNVTQTGTRPSITTTSLPAGQVGQAYSQTLAASGTAPITWTRTSGTLPTGLSLSSAGVISGTPTAGGSFTFTVRASNSLGNDSKSFTVSITVPTTPGDDVNLTGYAGYALTYQLTPAGTWTRTSGSLPSGMSLSRSGLLSGRPSRAGSYSATLSCATTTSSAKSKSSKNTKSGIVTVKVNFTINAKPIKPTIKTSSLPAGVVGTAYSQPIAVTGTAPVTLTVTGLPAGLSFNSSTGYITGTPTTPGTSTITIKAENLATNLDNSTVTKTIRLTIKAQPPTIADPGTLPEGIVGTAYDSVQFTTSAGTAPITWTASGLPAGLKISTSGLLYGTPTRAGTFTMTAKATNSGGNATLRVSIKVIEKPSVSSARMTNGTTDKSYTARFTAKGTTPITWKIEGLPDTMSFSQNSTGTTATVTGIPTEPGTFSVKLTLTNAAGSTSYTVTFTVNGVAPRLTASLSNARVGQSYTGSRISATGTKPMNISYSIAASDLARFGITGLGDLGLSFNSDSEAGTATITGTPLFSLRSLPITITAKNSVSTVTRRVTLSVIGERPTFTAPSDSTVNITCKVGSSISQYFTVKGSRNITYSMNSVSGFSLRQTGDFTAVLTGTAPDRDRTTTLTITAANPDGRATKRVVIKTQTPPTITTTSLATGTLNKNYSAKVAATGTKTIRWQVSGTLPTGVRFSNGSFSGKATKAGSFTFTLKATNSIGEDSKTYTITIDDPNAKSSTKSKSKSTTSAKSNTMDTDTAEPTITYGKVNALTNEAELEAKGYLIAAVLPEISVNVSGMYDIDVELYDDVPEGAELVWLAFPEEGKESDDDEIAEFYDPNGKEITRVPAGHRITVAPWLNKGVKYSPVIAVR